MFLSETRYIQTPYCSLSVETEEKCESTREAGLTGVSFMSGGQPVPWQ